MLGDRVKTTSIKRITKTRKMSRHIADAAFTKKSSYVAAATAWQTAAPVRVKVETEQSWEVANLHDAGYS